MGIEFSSEELTGRRNDEKRSPQISYATIQGNRETAYELFPSLTSFVLLVDL